MMKVVDKEIDIILPVYKPYLGWEELLQEKYDLLKAAFPDYCFKLILVNDGTPYDISESMTVIKTAYPNTIWTSHDHNYGKGRALRTGMHYTTSDRIIYTDYDFPYKVESMVKMINEFESGNSDVLTATRNESYYRSIPTGRRVISNLLKSFNQILLRLPVADTQGGLKMMNQDAKEVFLNTVIDRYLIDIEFLKKAQQAGLRIKPLAVELRAEIKLTQVSNLRILKELQSYLKIVFNAI